MPANRTDAFSFRDRFPQPVKALVKTGVEAYGQTTSGSRVLPDFVIVGAQRAGTTAMYEYVTEHPSIASATTKEVHYPDLHHDRGLSWYRGHFPTQASMEGIAERTGHAITGEASPYYLFHPLAARRLAQAVPDVRVIVMLRDPVERLRSHYSHAWRMGTERRPLPLALDAEAAVIGREARRLASGEVARSFEHQHHSYFSRGRYAGQLERWFGCFPAERILIVESERFFAQPSVGFDRVLGFLGLEPMRRVGFPRVHASDAVVLPEDVRERLRRAYEPHDRELGRLLGRDPVWSGAGPSRMPAFAGGRGAT